MIVPSLVRFGDSLMLGFGIKICQNMVKGPRSVSITTSRPTCSPLRALVPKKKGSHGYHMGSVIWVISAHVG